MDSQPAPVQWVGLRPATLAGVAKFITAPVERPGLSTVTIRLLEDMRNPAVRVEPARALLAATARAGSRGVIRLAEVGASAVVQREGAAVVHRMEAGVARRTEAVAGLGAVVAAIVNQRIGVLLVVDREI